jgi:hypothetical protein
MPSPWPKLAHHDRMTALTLCAGASDIEGKTFCLLRDCEKKDYYYVPSHIFNEMKFRGETGDFDLVYIVTPFGR